MLLLDKITEILLDEIGPYWGSPKINKAAVNAAGRLLATFTIEERQDKEEKSRIKRAYGLEAKQD